MPATVEMRQQVSVEERQIGWGVEIFCWMMPHKIAGGHTDRPQDFLRVAFSARGNLRLLTAPRPSAVKRGRLPKGRFIFINDYRPFVPGAFLDWDACTESTGSVSWGRLAPGESWGVAPKSSTA